MVVTIYRFAIAVLVSVACATVTAAPQKTSKAKHQPALKVKSGDYSSRGKLTRREFVEMTFGVKFGDKLDKYMDTKGGIDAEVMRLMSVKPEFPERIVSRKLASSVCGLKHALFIMSPSGELEAITLIPSVKDKPEKSLKAVRARLNAFNKTAGKWLGIQSFEIEENVSEERRDGYIEARFNDDCLDVYTSIQCEDRGSNVLTDGCSLMIMFTESEEVVMTDVEAAGVSVSKQTLPDDQPSKEKLAEKSEKSKNTQRHMKAIVIKRVFFTPPATIVDAVEFFKDASKDYDDPKLPPEKRGINITLRLMVANGSEDATVPELPKIDESNISLWDALDKVCASCGWTFVIEGSLVCVVPKGMVASKLITRGIKISERTVDSKAGTSDIKDIFKKTDKWKAWLEQQGVDWPDGSRMLYIQSAKTLRVTNTEDNLDKIEKLLVK